MTENHLSDDRLASLLYGEAEDGDREHLNQCRSCGERYGELTEALEALDRLAIPKPNAAEKQHVFDTAWRSSGLDCDYRPPGFLWPFLRHAASFIVGLACGMILLAAIVTKSGTENSQSNGFQTSGAIPAMLDGTRAAKIFSELENPIIVVRKEEINNTEQTKNENGDAQTQKSIKPKDTKSLNQEKRVIEGTTDDGRIQVVWNL